MNTPKKRTLDSEIERIYMAKAAGRQIDIMNICKVFDAARAAYKAGLPVEPAIVKAIDTYCTPVNRY